MKTRTTMTPTLFFSILLVFIAVIVTAVQEKGKPKAATGQIWEYSQSTPVNIPGKGTGVQTIRANQSGWSKFVMIKTNDGWELISSETHHKELVPEDFKNIEGVTPPNEALDSWVHHYTTGSAMRLTF